MRSRGRTGSLGKRRRTHSLASASPNGPASGELALSDPRYQLFDDAAAEVARDFVDERYKIYGRAVIRSVGNRPHNDYRDTVLVTYLRYRSALHLDTERRR